MLVTSRNGARAYATAGRSPASRRPFCIPGARTLRACQGAHPPEPGPQASAPLRRPWRTGFQSLRRLSGRRLGGASSLPAGSACAQRLPRRGAGSGRRRGAPRVGRGVTGSSLGRGGRDGGGASVPRVSSGPRRWGAGGPRRPFPAGRSGAGTKGLRPMVCGKAPVWPHLPACGCSLVPGSPSLT